MGDAIKSRLLENIRVSKKKLKKIEADCNEARLNYQVQHKNLDTFVLSNGDKNVRKMAQELKEGRDLSSSELLFGFKALYYAIVGKRMYRDNDETYVEFFASEDEKSIILSKAQGNDLYQLALAAKKEYEYIENMLIKAVSAHKKLIIDFKEYKATKVHNEKFKELTANDSDLLSKHVATLESCQLNPSENDEVEVQIQSLYEKLCIFFQAIVQKVKLRFSGSNQIRA